MGEQLFKRYAQGRPPFLYLVMLEEWCLYPCNSCNFSTSFSISCSIYSVGWWYTRYTFFWLVSDIEWFWGLWCLKTDTLAHLARQQYQHLDVWMGRVTINGSPYAECMEYLPIFTFSINLYAKLGKHASNQSIIVGSQVPWTTQQDYTIYGCSKVNPHIFLQKHEFSNKSSTTGVPF